MFGEQFVNGGEHRTCFGACKSAMRELVSAMPKFVMCVTVKGDLLLPKGKHSSLLVKALRERRREEGEEGKEGGGGKGGEGEGEGEVTHVHAGPFYLPHGCGLHKCWKEEGREFLKRADGELGEEKEEEESGGGEEEEVANNRV